MTLTLQTIIDAARDRDSSFAKQRVPDAIFARYLTGYQRELVARAHEIRPGIIESQISLVFQPNGLALQSPLGTIGAGTASGLPVVPAPNPPGGSPLTQAAEQAVGNTVELDFANAPVLWPKTVVLSATQNTLTVSPAIVWSTNQFANAYVTITDGTDVFDRQLIISNTGNVLTIAGAGWTTVPDATSLFMILQPQPIVTQETGVALALPAQGKRYAYLVQYDANGNPFLNLANPLIGTFEQGIPLPPHKALLRGTIYFSTNVNPFDIAPLKIVDVSKRLNAWGMYTAWTDNTNLYLIGQRDDWQTVASIDLRYVPEPQPITQLTDTFVLPDSAYSPLVSAAAWMAAERVYNAPDTPEVDVERYRAIKLDSEQIWLNELGSRFRAQVSYVEEVW